MDTFVGVFLLHIDGASIVYLVFLWHIYPNAIRKFIKEIQKHDQVKSKYCINDTYRYDENIYWLNALLNNDSFIILFSVTKEWVWQTYIMGTLPI